MIAISRSCALKNVNLKTVFCLLDMRCFSWLVAGVTPFSLRPVIGHLGTEGRFFKYCKKQFKDVYHQINN